MIKQILVFIERSSLAYHGVYKTWFILELQVSFNSLFQYIYGLLHYKFLVIQRSQIQIIIRVILIILFNELCQISRPIIQQIKQIIIVTKHSFLHITNQIEQFFFIIKYPTVFNISYFKVIFYLSDVDLSYVKFVKI